MMQHKVNTQPLPVNNFDILTKRGKQKNCNNSFPQTLVLLEKNNVLWSIHNSHKHQ